jgi:flagellar basal-body rod protein FlgF
MVDKALYIGTSGAKDAMHQLEIITNNLANVNTTGFRADHEVMKQVPVSANGQQSRVYTAIGKTYSDFKPGPIVNTGRDLDVAISGQGFIAVQTKAGKEAYTRAGDLMIKDGLLMTQAGDVVLGSSGVVSLPTAAERISIGSDGTISARMKGAHENVNVNRIKLTNPAIDQLDKGADGLFYLQGEGNTAHFDEKIRIVPGSLEGSNVNPVETLTTLIELSRSFEMHTNLMKNIQSNSEKANQVLQLPK